MHKITEKQIYLSGGGDENQSLSFDKFFFNSFPKNGKLLYIPIALREYSDIYNNVNLWMEKILNLHNRNDIQLCIWKNIPPLINLKEFHGIYIGGGNTWSLMKEIKSSIFYNSLINYIENGGLIYGGSAGAIIIGKRIDTQTDENAVDLKDFQGFDMLNGYSIACHFNKKQTKKFKKWSEDNNLPIICLPEDNGIVINSKKIKCIGSSECIIFTPKKCITLNNNESFNIN